MSYKNQTKVHNISNVDSSLRPYMLAFYLLLSFPQVYIKVFLYVSRHCNKFLGRISLLLWIYALRVDSTPGILDAKGASSVEILQTRYGT